MFVTVQHSTPALIRFLCVLKERMKPVRSTSVLGFIQNERREKLKTLLKAFPLAEVVLRIM